MDHSLALDLLPHLLRNKLGNGFARIVGLAAGRMRTKAKCGHPRHISKASKVFDIIL